MPWIDVSCLSVTSLLSLSSFRLPSITDWLTEDTDLIPGMMLSNCRAETDLHNQTIAGKMGHVGKQLFLACLGAICQHIPYLSYKCSLLLEMSVMCTCFLRAELMLFCYGCSGYRYKSIEHSTSSSSINTFACSLDAPSLSPHRADFYKPFLLPAYINCMH